MRRVWAALLAGCGYPPLPAVVTTDAPVVDAANPDGATPASACWTVSDATSNAHWFACTAPSALASSINVIASVSINTDGGDSSPSGYSCAPLTAGSADVCALAAGSITIEKAAVLFAHGTKPLALLGHTVDIEGTIDVASRIHGPRGTGSIDDCNPNPTLATVGGGGAGGTFVAPGGKGGDQGDAASTGGLPGFTESASTLHGGCDGRRGGDGTTTGGPDGVGGAGGGAVWISSDIGMLTLGNDAVINASGASGAGASQDEHGGHGGGSGGMIVLQSSAITRDANAQIFANGGHGGGGAAGGKSGSDGTDPTGPASGGGGGQGGLFTPNGDGGSGYPAPAPDGVDGEVGKRGGGGGGGGGPGAIRVASTTSIGGANVSPPPSQWTP